MIDDCIEDLRNGSGTKLREFASLAQSIADSRNESVFHVLPPAVATFAYELSQSRTLVMIPVLPDQLRERYNTLISSSVNSVVEAFKTLKQELCDKDSNPSHEKLLQALATITKHGGKLFGERLNIMRTGEPRPPTSPDTELG